jgi:hypothetical protein
VGLLCKGKTSSPCLCLVLKASDCKPDGLHKAVRGRALHSLPVLYAYMCCVGGACAVALLEALPVGSSAILSCKSTCACILKVCDGCLLCESTICMHEALHVFGCLQRIGMQRPAVSGVCCPGTSQACF